MGVLVWEESLGWGNNAKQMGDPEYFRLQVEQTRAMVRASFNHPSVIIFAFQNENASQTKEGKKMNDALIEAIRSQDSDAPRPVHHVPLEQPRRQQAPQGQLLPRHHRP
jgi:beta-glucuronidase